MERNLSMENRTTAIIETTTDTCYLFTSLYFETGSSTAPYIVNAALNVPLAIIGTLANILVFSAIRKTTSLHLPSKLLLCGLVLTDLGVSFVTQPLFVAFLIAKVKRVSDIRCFCITAYIFGGAMLVCASLMTMAAISVDRYIAFHFYRRYRGIVTAKRVCVVLAFIWSLAGIFASTYYWSSSLWSRSLYSFLVFIIMFICFVVTSLAYIKIYRGLRDHQRRLEERATAPYSQTGSTLNVENYRRSASSMLWIYCLFVFCFWPYVFAIVARQIVGQTVFLQCILEFTVTIGFLNSCLNPFIYCFRLPDIRAIVLQTLRKICCKAPSEEINF